jgi:NAD(P)-dependent dehydrogenase (short-subunit alcohol dehydrogenase family)
MSYARYEAAERANQRTMFRREDDQMAVKRRKALVTGSAAKGGTSRAIAERLKNDGFEVVTLDIDPGCTFQADVVEGDLPILDDIDVFVGNAALTRKSGNAHDVPLDRWQRDLDVNLTGTFRVLQACLGGMRDRKYGRIILVSAAAAVAGLPEYLSFATSKAGLVGLARTVAAENAELGITANVVVPDSAPETTTLPPDRDPKLQEDAELAEDVADACAFFSSQESARVTGQILIVGAGNALDREVVSQ